MKKGLNNVLFVSALLLISLSPSLGQVHFKLGPMGGMNTSLINTNLPYNQQVASAGYFGGVFGRMEINKFYLQPEVFFNSKSVAISGNNAAGAYNVNFDLSSYDLNLLAGYEIKKLGSIANVRGFAGAGKSFQSTTKVVYKNVTFPEPNLNDGSVNGVIGIGMDVLRLTADIRLQQSLTNLYGNNPQQLSSTVFMFTLGLKFF